MMPSGGQLDMFPTSAYPEEPGARRTDTSQEAAESLAREATNLQSLCLSSITALCGATADEIAADLQRNILSIRPRIAELHKLGQIRDSGERRRNDSGRRAIVWEIST